MWVLTTVRKIQTTYQRDQFRRLPFGLMWPPRRHLRRRPPAPARPQRKGKCSYEGSALRCLFHPNAPVQWQADGLTIHTKKWFLGAGFLGAHPISLTTHCREPPGSASRRQGHQDAPLVARRRPSPALRGMLAPSPPSSRNYSNAVTKQVATRVRLESWVATTPPCANRKQMAVVRFICGSGCIAHACSSWSGIYKRLSNPTMTGGSGIVLATRLLP